MSERFEYVPLTEEEIYRMSGLGDLWDRVEAGDQIASLLKDRIDAARHKVQPTIDAMLEEVWSTGTPGAEGLAALLKP